MKWIEPNITEIITTNIVYFSNEFPTSCQRICEALDISLLPDIEHKLYWVYEKDRWDQKEIKNEQKIDLSFNVFDKRIIKKMDLAPSNILFYDAGEIINGVIHFTDYEHKAVYHSLYKNFYTFESCLRDYLSHFNFSYVDVENYYEYKIQKEKKKEFLTKRLETIRSPKFKEEAKSLRKLQKLDLRELMMFSKSSYHEQETKRAIGLTEIKVTQIANLRNTIMHAKGFTGNTEEFPHNYQGFKKYFGEVQYFKEAFFRLLFLRSKQILKRKKKYNNELLDQINKMNDKEIIEHFYNWRL